MTTTVKLTDTLPKDAGGAKFQAVIDDQTSQSDFALIKGVGASSFGNPAQVLAHMAVATHTQGSPIWAENPGVLVGGVMVDQFTTAPSPVAPGQFQNVLMSNWGEMFVSGAPKTASHLSTSRNTIKATSGIVFGFSAGWKSATESSPIYISNSTSMRMSILTHNTSGFGSMPVPQGGILFDTNIIVDIPAGAGNASVTVFYR